MKIELFEAAPLENRPMKKHILLRGPERNSGLSRPRSSETRCPRAILVAVAVFSALVLSATTTPDPDKGGRSTNEGPRMPVAVIAPTSPVTPANPSLYLAGALVLAASDCAARPQCPSDHTFADTLLSRALAHLQTGLAGDIDSPTLAACTDAIASCGYLSATVRRQLSTALVSVADGSVPPIMALELVKAAADSQAYRMLVHAAREIGADGLSEIAGAIELNAADTETEH